MFDDGGKDLPKRRNPRHDQTGVFSQAVAEKVIRLETALLQQLSHGAFENEQSGVCIEQPAKRIKSVRSFLVNNLDQRLVDQRLCQFVRPFKELAKDRFMDKQIATHLIVLGALPGEHPDAFFHGCRFDAALKMENSNSYPPILIRFRSPERTFPGPISTN